MLKKNPFPSSVVPRRDVIFWADREKVKEHLLDFVKRKTTGNVETLLLLGDYGQGKTHAMLLVSILCKRKNVPCVYVPNPGESFADLSRKTIESIGFENIVLMCNQVLQNNKEKILEKMKTDKTIRLLSIEGMSTERMIRYAFPLIDVDLAIVLGHIYNNRLIDLSRSWILGRDLTRTEMGKLNVSRSVTTDESASKILSDILRIVLSINNKFILLVDEFEDLANLSSSRALAYGKAFRRFIDENISNLKIIVSMTRDAYTMFQRGAGIFHKKSYMALVDRINYPRIELEGLSETEIRKFIKDFVSRRYKGPLENIITGDAILAILNEAVERYMGSPRGVISICHMIFDEAIRKSAWPINKEVVEDISESLPKAEL